MGYGFHILLQEVDIGFIPLLDMSPDWSVWSHDACCGCEILLSYPKLHSLNFHAHWLRNHSRPHSLPISLLLSTCIFFRTTFKTKETNSLWIKFVLNKRWNIGLWTLGNHCPFNANLYQRNSFKLVSQTRYTKLWI